MGRGGVAGERVGSSSRGRGRGRGLGGHQRLQGALKNTGAEGGHLLLAPRPEHSHVAVCPGLVQTWCELVQPLRLRMDKHRRRDADGGCWPQ